MNLSMDHILTMRLYVYIYKVFAAYVYIYYIACMADISKDIVITCNIRFCDDVIHRQTNVIQMLV